MYNFLNSQLLGKTVKSAHKFILLFVTTIILINLSCQAFKYNPLDIQQDSVFENATTPEKAIKFLNESFNNNIPEKFYYLLSAKIRQKLPFWKIHDEWANIKQNFGKDFLKSVILKVEYISPSPFEPEPAARVVVEYPHPQNGFIIENFLFLLEISDEFRESKPVWRLYFPFADYQNNAIWFTTLTGKIDKQPTNPSDKN